MPVKDYYALLHIKPGADAGTIKRAFRKLAMQYHPDKRESSDLNNAYFREIQEAYDILSNPQKRDEYHYNRWLENAMGHTLEKSMKASDILKRFIQVEKFIYQSDKYRIDQRWLGRQIISLFSEDRLLIISQQNDASLVSEVNRIALAMANELNLEDAALLANQIQVGIPIGNVLGNGWKQCIKVKRRKQLINRFKIPIAIFITMLICILIYRIMH